MKNRFASPVVLLGLVFGGLIVFHAFVQPFQSEAVYEAIPAQASFVFKAENLEELLQSPVCGQLDKALGAGMSLNQIADSNGWVSLAAASEIAVADIPFRDAGRQKTWAAVSWVGWRSPWLRWRLEHSRNRSLKFLGKHAVWPIWQYNNPAITRDMHLTFTLTDNLFIACLSENPTDILLLLDTYDKRTLPAFSGKGT